jgi:hypothetical protein
MKAACVICGSPFEKTHPDAVLCGQPDCQQEYESLPATIARQTKAREYYAANREKIRERYAANREEVLEKARERRAAGPEKILEYQREYRAANREKIHEYQREYYAANRESISERRAARRLESGKGGEPS